MRRIARFVSINVRQVSDHSRLKNSAMAKHSILDPLYGEVDFDARMLNLIHAPAVQRLRDVRLSNIDSISMTGIANISRFEHALGTAYLARHVGFLNRLSEADSLVLQASALLHDVFIAPFGHLIEEALSYVGVEFKHEDKAGQLLEGRSESELGGVNLQLGGREAGIAPWAEKTFGQAAAARIRTIFAAGQGAGQFGACIAGGVDLDNLDNLTRIAFHMGLEVDRTLPVTVARMMIDTTDSEGLTFSPDVVPWIRQWLRLRRDVYTHLMLSRDDFAAKLMLVYATVIAYQRQCLTPSQLVWTLTDRELVERLLGSQDPEVRKTTQSWLLSELWPLSDLMWLAGSAPPYSSMYEFSAIASDRLGRPCFCYRIGDKRVRLIKLRLANGATESLGEAPARWVLGVAARLRSKAFTADDNRRLRSLATEFFGTRCLHPGEDPESHTSSLFG